MHELELMAQWLAPRLLASVDDGSGEGGGGGGSGAGLTAEQVTEIVNKAISSHVGRLKKQLQEESKERNAAMDAIIKAWDEEQDEEQDDGGEKGDGKGEKPSAGPDPATARELAAIRKQLEKTEKERDAEKAARAKEAEDRARSEERTQLAEQLTAAGVSPKRVKAAVALLHGDEKRVTRDEKGRILFRGDDEDEVPLADGVKAWVKSEIGQEFVPPRKVGGSGGEGGGSGTLGTRGKDGQTQYSDADLGSVMGDIMGRAEG